MKIYAAIIFAFLVFGSFEVKAQNRYDCSFTPEIIANHIKSVAEKHDQEYLIDIQIRGDLLFIGEFLKGDPAGAIYAFKNNCVLREMPQARIYPKEVMKEFFGKERWNKFHSPKA